MTALQADEIFACLDRHGVRFVVIGGLAAVLHGSPLATLDLDICPSRENANLARLRAALDELKARIRSSDSSVGVAFPLDAAFLGSVEILNLTTGFGDLALVFLPPGTRGFDDLIHRAVSMKIHATDVPVASVEDLIRSKEASKRPKDLRSLPLLRQLLDEIRKRR
jgi:hypothetical protein